MIKKFKEFFNEKYMEYEWCVNNIDVILPPDEIDDHFLKLEEVFNLDVKWDYDPKRPRINMIIKPKFDSYNPDENLEKIKSEISEIKSRMKRMFPVEITVNDVNIQLQNEEISTGFVVIITVKNDALLLSDNNI